MKKFILSGLACAGLVLAMPETVYAHGGQYRGPGDVVPPNPGGGGGRTPGPSGPSTPGPSGPSTPGPSGPSSPGPAGPSTGGPAGPGGGGGPSTGGGGASVGDDLTRWEFWWEFNKDPFINLREAVHATGEVTNSDDFFMGAGKRREGRDTLKPTEAQILGTILPKLKQALDSTDQRDITSSCMVAMAKIGKNANGIDILDEFRQRLTSRDQEIRETAALAIGISQMTDGVNDLVSLVSDTEQGRKLVDRPEVDDRTRSFSAYGLGLIAYATSNADVKRQVFDALKKQLEDENLPGRNIPVALISAMGLLQPDATDEKGKTLLGDAVRTLEKYYDRKVGPGQQQLQAHCPTAIAKLLENSEDDELRKYYKSKFLTELEGKSKLKKTNNDVFMSSAIALGRIARPYEDKSSEDKDIGEALWKYYTKGKDQQTTYFALMGLAQQGGAKNREYLLKALKDGSKALEKPWAAISLGVYCYNKMQDEGQNAEVDTLVGRALRDWFGKLKTPATQAALAIGMGLVKYADAADEIRDQLEAQKNKDDLAGYLCISLALMEDQRSVSNIQDLVKASVRRPTRLQQAAIALGKLGDKSVTELLQGMMADGDSNLAKMSAIASALGFIGDRRTVDPLVKMLFDESLTDLSRAFAAVALGGVADKELLPWNTKLSINMNYRAAVETLTNQVSGILDIL